jgi:ribonuclease R
VLKVLERRGRALLSPAAIAAELGLGRGASKTIRRLLRQLESDGRVDRIRGRFRARRGDGLLEGRFEPAPRGAGGLVIDESGGRWRVGSANGARPGDRVAIQPWGEPEKPRADIMQIVEGARDHWVGIFHRRGRLAFATAYRDDGEWMLRVARPDTGGAEEGDVVELVPVTGRGGRRRGEEETPWARVRARLGRPGDADADAAAVIWRHRLPRAFPPEVEEEASERAGWGLEEEIDRRVDLRERELLTIDPADARDHDDAICVDAREGGGFRLWVAIADVSHYVTPGSHCDREALLRGNSTYFVDRAIPMLPAPLSSDACSLRPQVDRLAVVAEMAFDAAGRLERRSFYPAVVRSQARLAYAEAAEIMAGRRPHPLAAMLGRLDALTALLLERRRERGALDLDLPESAIALDAKGHPTDVFRRPRTRAHRAVEEAMLAANRAVAELLREAEVPGPFRNHEAPAPQDADALAQRLAAFGVLDGSGSLTPKRLASAVARVDEADARVVHPLVLRAMRQARYGAECRGHFALAFESYVHFTSPIRRYPDLVIHRRLKECLETGTPELDAGRAGRISARCSFRERLAERAERELVDLKKCSFLAAYVGEEFEGTVTGVARHGLYVSLDRWPIEGLVHVSSLPDFVTLDEGALTLVTDDRRRSYALGDRWRVAVTAVDLVRARIDLSLLRRLEPSPLLTRKGGGAGRRTHRT